MILILIRFTSQLYQQKAYSLNFLRRVHLLSEFRKALFLFCKLFKESIFFTLLWFLYFPKTLLWVNYEFNSNLNGLQMHWKVVYLPRNWFLGQAFQTNELLQNTVTLNRALPLEGQGESAWNGVRRKVRRGPRPFTSTWKTSNYSTARKSTHA